MRYFWCVITVFVLFAGRELCADGFNIEPVDPAKIAEQQPVLAPVDQEGQLDPRLPPVIPGQSVKIGDKKVKLWSSSGRVSAGPAPAAAQAEQPNSVPEAGAVGVIIDRRR